MPLAFATGAVAVVFACTLFGLPGLTLVISRVFTLMGNYVLVSVPLFIFMACILERAGVAEAIFRAVHVWSGRLRGGLAVAVIISCALMAAMVGVIGAEIVTMGVVALPAMLARGYEKDLALGCICAGGGLATLIPPSVVFIMYGLTAGVSIGQLYMAGVVPGLLLAGLVHRLHRHPLRDLQPELAPPRDATRSARCRSREKLAMLGELVAARRWWPSSVLGSLYLGWATPTEAAGVGVVGALVAMLVERPPDAGRASRRRRRRHDQGHRDALLAVLRLVGADRRLHAGRRHQADPGHDDRRCRSAPIGVIIMIQVIWIVLGCFIDWIGILLLTAPIFVPVARASSASISVWLGVLFCMNMQISYISPPFGPGRVLPEGRDAARHHAGRHLPLDLAVPRPADRRARAGDRLPADRALAAEHHGAMSASLDRTSRRDRRRHAGAGRRRSRRRGRARSPGADAGARDRMRGAWSSAAAPAASPRRSPRRAAAAASTCSRRPTGSAAS